MASKSVKNVKYKKEKLSSDVMAEILRSDDEDELIEFINSSFPKNGPGVANNNKKRSTANGKINEDGSMQEIDLNGTRAGTTYDLSNSESIIVGDKYPRTSRFRFVITCGLFVSFLALGVSVAILGPCLLDLSVQVNSSFKKISWIFTARSMGYLLGSIIGGWILDRWNSYLLLAASCFFTSVTLVITPLTKSYFMLVVIIICQGLATGSLDTGGNVLILNLYGKNGDAQMQALHAMFGLGAFVSPFLASPFLVPVQATTLHTNTTAGNVTIIPTSAWNSSYVNQSTTNAPDIIKHSNLQWPYVMSMLFFVIPVITFLVAGFKESGKCQQASKPWENVSSNNEKAFKGFILVLLFVFLLLYVGMEVAMGGLIFSFSIKHGILKSKSLAAYLTSTFWGSFCFGRFLGIPLSMYVRAYRILVISLCGCAIGSCLLVFVSTSVQAWLWIGTSLLGLSMAAVFPSTLSWAETFMNISGKTASVLVVGAALGEMTIPLVIGSLMHLKGADAFLDAIFVVTVLAILVFILASILARRQQKAQMNSFGMHYTKNTDTNHSTLFSKGDEIVQLLEDSSEIFSAVDN